jgi:hypothetical protein
MHSLDSPKPLAGRIESFKDRLAPNNFAPTAALPSDLKREFRNYLPPEK